jgi:hypothetical protein
MAVKLAMNAERAAEDAYRIAGLRRKAATHVDAPHQPAAGNDPGGRHPAQDPDPAGSTERPEPPRH